MRNFFPGPTPLLRIKYLIKLRKIVFFQRTLDQTNKPMRIEVCPKLRNNQRVSIIFETKYIHLYNHVSNEIFLQQ